MTDLLDEIETVVEQDEEQNRILGKDIPETEREQLIKSRRGQGLFRNRLEGIEDGCRVTGVTDKCFLIASHIKPWKDSNDEEKLDGNNGLLLSPHADKLFDQGWITFLDERIICASEAVTKILEIWNIDLNKKIGALNKLQKSYLKHHKNHVYRG